MMDDFIAIDFETRDDGTPWQLGAAKFVGGTLVETKDWRFDGGALGDRPLPWLTEEVMAYLMGSTLVAHNIACEKTLLTKAAPITKWGPWQDTLKIAKKRYPGLASYKLEDLCKQFGIADRSVRVPDRTLEGRTWHDGLFDAIMCGLLYCCFEA